MKTMKLKGALSLLLSLVMVFSMIYIAAPSAYAEGDVTWPQITEESITVDESKWAWKYTTTDFVSEYKGLKVTQYPAPVEHALSTEAQPLYEVGVIDLYFTALPTAEQRKSRLTGLQCNTGSIIVDTDTINWNGTEKAEDWDGFTTITTAAQVNWKNGNETEYSFSGTMYDNARGFIIQTDDGNIKYSYKIRLAEYAETESLLLKNSSVRRGSKQNAEISFTSSSTGSYWYEVYDTKQENPVIDTTQEGYTLNENTNTLSITDLSSYTEKYVYIQGKNETATSNILEVIVPAFTFKIEHELKYLDGFTIYIQGNPTVGYFYSEYFTDIDGTKITEAIPGDTVKVVFNANGGTIQEQYTLTENDLIVGYAKAYKLAGWNITGAEVDEATVSNNTEFSFIMPESNVSVNADLVLSGAKIKFTSNIPAPGIPNSLSWEYYDVFSDSWSSMNDYILPEGQLEYEDTFKTGLKFRANSYFKPGLDIGSYIFKEIKVLNNGTDLEPTEETLYDTGFTLQEGDNYEFRFVFRPKAYALIETETNDSNMGSASASVNSTTVVYEGETVTLTATPKEGYVLKEWQVKDDNGTVIPVTSDPEDPNKASFVMTADYSDKITATAVFVSDDYIPVVFNHTCLVQNSLAIAFKAGGVDWTGYSDIYLHIERQAYAKNDPECTWKTEDIRDYTIDDRGRCVFTYSGISAAEMGDQIKATVYATKDGKEYVSDTDTYSIATYAYNTLENYKDDAALRTLLVDMLNYGSEAQAYFDKNVGNLVNATLTETQKSWATPGSISYENCKADGTFAGATARVSSRSLVLEETVKLKAYMMFDTTPGSNVKVVFRYTAASGQEKVTEVNSKDFVYDSAKNRYSAMLTTIAPPDFKKPISIKIYDGSTQISAEYTYSVESYAYSASQWEGSQYDALKTLVSAMIKYSRSAETYFQQIQ